MDLLQVVLNFMLYNLYNWNVITVANKIYLKTRMPIQKHI